MHVIAVAASFTAAVNVLFAFCVHEICHWGKYCVYLFPSEKSSVNIFLGNLCIVFIRILYVNISHQMITQIINNNHIFDFTVLAHFLENVFIEFLKPWIRNEITFQEPFRRLIAWHGYRRWGRFRWDCFHTCVRVRRFNWWEVCYGFFRNCLRIDRLRFCRRMDSSLCPFRYRTLLITFRPLR